MTIRSWVTSNILIKLFGRGITWMGKREKEMLCATTKLLKFLRCTSLPRKGEAKKLYQHIFIIVREIVIMSRFFHGNLVSWHAYCDLMIIIHKVVKRKKSSGILVCGYPTMSRSGRPRVELPYNCTPVFFSRAILAWELYPSTETLRSSLRRDCEKKFFLPAIGLTTTEHAHRHSEHTRTEKFNSRSRVDDDK